MKTALRLVVPIVALLAPVSASVQTPAPVSIDTLMATPLFNRIMRDRPAPALPATDGPPA